jgi:hypothetical protein
MTASRLLRLYPRAWRDRYGEEFLATTGAEKLHPQQVIDIIGGAIDAWLSTEVRRSLLKNGTPTRNGGMIMHHVMSGGCTSSKFRYTTRDALIGAAVMLLVSVGCSIGGVIARRNDMPVLGMFLMSIGFPAAMTLSMPFTFMKGQPWRAQVVIVGGTQAILSVITYLAART